MVTPARETTPALVKFHAPEVVFGYGALAEAGFAAVRPGGRRPTVVSDRGVVHAGWVDELLGYLRAAGQDPTDLAFTNAILGATQAMSHQVRGLLDAAQGMPRGLRELGVTDGDVTRLAASTLDDSCLTTNPRSANHADIVDLFQGGPVTAPG